jgi:hypothetical protein
VGVPLKIEGREAVDGESRRHKNLLLSAANGPEQPQQDGRSEALLGHFIGGREQRCWDREPERRGWSTPALKGPPAFHP